MNLNDIATQLLFTTVAIKGITRNNNQITGTGFFFQYDSANGTIPLLVTNKHVVNDLVSGQFSMFSGNDDGTVNLQKTIPVNFELATTAVYTLGNLDLVVIPIAQVFNQMSEHNIKYFYRTVSADMLPNKEQVDDLSAIETLTFIGYPAGLIDTKNSLPIVRQGISATPIWNDLDGSPYFLIDGGVFPGSSGSPVFVYNNGSYPDKGGITVGTRLYFVGIIFQTRTHKNGKDETTYLDLGQAINSEAFMLELKNTMKSLDVE